MTYKALLNSYAQWFCTISSVSLNNYCYTTNYHEHIVGKNGELRIFHDDYLHRTINVDTCFLERKNNPLHWFSLEEIQQLDVGSWFVTSDPFGEIGAGNVPQSEQDAIFGTTISTLKEVLVFVKVNSCYVNIEIKTLPTEIASFPVAEKELRLIEELQMDPALIATSSFARDYLKQIQEKRPDIENQHTHWHT